MPKTVRTPVFTRYELLDELGSGGMGTVYKARQQFVGRLVAFKVLPPALRRDAEALQRFEREAAALGRLKHPNVVTVYDAGVERGFPYMAMEYIEGQNLRQVLKENNPMPIAEILGMGIAMAEALDHVQKQGLVHRDVKPSNIMVTPEGTYVLTDFGIAFTAAMPRITQGAMGTPEFMSPEQVRGESLDIRSDLYSLGVVLYECLAGTTPFQLKDESLTSLSHLTQQVIHTTPPPVQTHRPDTPLWLTEVVQQCLAKDPEDRFQTGAALAKALRRENGTETEAPSLPKAEAPPAPEPPAPVATPPPATQKTPTPPPAEPPQPTEPPRTETPTPAEPPRTQPKRIKPKENDRPSPAIAPPKRVAPQTGPPFDAVDEGNKLPAKRKDTKRKKAPASKAKNPRARTAFLVWLVIGILLWGYFIIAQVIEYEGLDEGLFGLNLFGLTPALTGALTTLFSRSKKKSKVGRGILLGVLFGVLLSFAATVAILDIPLDAIQFDDEALLSLGGLCLISATASAVVTGLVLKIRSMFTSTATE